MSHLATVWILCHKEAQSAVAEFTFMLPPKKNFYLTSFPSIDMRPCLMSPFNSSKKKLKEVFMVSYFSGPLTIAVIRKCSLLVCRRANGNIVNLWFLTVVPHPH